MKNALILTGIVFAVTLAITVGSRLSDEAMAVVVGAVCGLSASIPMSIGLAIAASQNWGQVPNNQPENDASFTERRTYSPQPPFVVINPSPYAERGMYPYDRPQPFSNFPTMPSNLVIKPREFKIIGEE
jgi:hypothetical protein